MSLRMLLLSCVGIFGLAIVAIAQDDPAPPVEVGQDREAGDSDVADDADADEGTDDVFIPTEEIPADEEVTFPVNI